jgi:catechol-2,3-dioxygenase
MRKMRAVGQLALTSVDPMRVAEFYESAFGFQRRAVDEAGVDLELGSFELSFRRGERAARDGMQIGFRVDTAGEVDAWAQELSQRGFALVGPPSGDRWEGTRSVRLADPDGRQVAVLYHYPPG